MTRRQELDHLRYMRNREERKRKQREYYAAHREQCYESVKRSRAKAKQRAKEEKEKSYNEYVRRLQQQYTASGELARGTGGAGHQGT